MLTLLTIATVFIAVVLAVVHWRTVREMLLWTAAILNVLSMILGLLALLGALVVFLWAAVTQNATLVPLGVMLALIFGGLLLLVGILSIIEDRDREKQFAGFRAWSLAEFYKRKRGAVESPDKGP